MTEHTELPWQGPLSARDCKERNVIDDADGRTLLLIVGITVQSRGERKRAGDALVRICNSHKDLLKACDLLITANQHVRDLSLNRDEAHRGMIWGQARSILDVAKIKAEVVIRKAKP